VLGSHPCAIPWRSRVHLLPYEEPLIETLADYLAAGLHKGERCFCAQKPHLIPRLLNTLSLLGIDIEAAKSSGALEVPTEDEVYFADGEFDPKSMIKMLESSIEASLARGFSGFRTAGEMSWALSECKNGRAENYCDQLVEYELMGAGSVSFEGSCGTVPISCSWFPAQCNRIDPGGPQNGS
jgi:hypothetical protein